jgi:uncharacterized membrane protein YbhN (UPF0104 family)
MKVKTKKSKYLKIVGLLLKVSVSIFALIYIFQKIKNSEHLETTIDTFKSAWSIQNESIYVLFSALVLVIINWGIEALKWYIFIQKVERISYGKAYMATLTGLTFSLFTPNRSGEFAGKLLFVRARNRVLSVLISVICSMGQLAVTLMLGTLSLMAFIQLYHPEKLDSVVRWLFFSVSGISIFVVLMAYINFGFVARFIKPFERKWKKLKSVVNLLNQLYTYEYLKVLFLSTLRFSIYCFQYYLLLLFFGVTLSADIAVLLIPLNFLGITLIPSIAFAEIGIRELVALTFIGSLGYSEPGIVAATFALWLINVAVPALFGAVFIWQTRIFQGS